MVLLGLQLLSVRYILPGVPQYLLITASLPKYVLAVREIVWKIPQPT
jgi:hypothetical protein